jgi:uncharacterized protein with von Willebrand factor type A (vWA) domain
MYELEEIQIDALSRLDRDELDNLAQDLIKGQMRLVEIVQELTAGRYPMRKMREFDQYQQELSDNLFDLLEEE